MSLPSLTDAPPLVPPPRTNSPSKGVRKQNLSRKKNQRAIKSQASIDALFSDDAEELPKASLKHSKEPMEAKQAKLQMELKQATRPSGKDPIADLFADEDLHIPGIRALATGRDLGKKQEEGPQRSLAFSLGNEMLEADLKSLSHPEFEKASPRTPREEFLLDRRKRVTLVQQVGPLADVIKPSQALARSPPPTSWSRPQKLEIRAPDKACC